MILNTESKECPLRVHLFSEGEENIPGRHLKVESEVGTLVHRLCKHTNIKHPLLPSVFSLQVSQSCEMFPLTRPLLLAGRVDGV